MTPEELVRGLEDLKRGEEAQLRLIAMGEAAVEPLGRFLLGPASLHPQPRMLAAEALGIIGGARATDALIAGLLAGDPATLPPVLRLSEEAVRNCVARELGRLGNPATIGPLLEALRRFHLIEAGRALARFRDLRALPSLIDCLEDPFIRGQAAAAIEEFGRDAVGPLLESLGRRRLRAGAEVRPSLERRAESARLLGELKDPRAEAPLAACLAEEAPGVRLAAAIALAKLAVDTRGEILAALVEGLRSPDPVIADESAEALVAVGPAAVPPLVAAVSAEAERTDAPCEVVPGPALRRIARTLARLGEPGVAALVSLARDPRPVVRGLAVANLGEAHSPQARRALLKARNDPDPRVRRTAEALSEPRTPHEGPLAVRGLSVLCGTIRRRLGRALSRIGHG